MTERPTLQVLNTFVAVGKASHEGRPQPKLCMTWAVDPVTGKLAARWVSRRIETTASVRLSPAA